MTLEELNELKKQADSDEWAAKKATIKANELAELRKREGNALTVFLAQTGHWQDKELRALIEEVINECAHDILRIAEMRQEALARLKKEQAKIKLAAISALLGEGN